MTTRNDQSAREQRSDEEFILIPDLATTQAALRHLGLYGSEEEQ
jgi:hypothetical protein